MTDDITYMYVKGQGWVPARYESATAVIGKYTVTVINKAPDRKDKYIVGSIEEDVQGVLDNLARYDTHKFEDTPRWWFSTWTRECERDEKRREKYGSARTSYKYFTIKFELIKPPKKVKKSVPEAPAGIFAELEVNPTPPRRRPRRAR